MKRNFVLILVFFLLFFNNQNILAQEKSKSENFIGIKAGADMSALNLNVSFSNNFYIKQGNTAGIVFKNLSKKTTGLILELNYTEKGGQNFFERGKLIDSTGIDSLIIPFNHSLTYIEFPFLMNLRLGKNKSKINLNVGPHIGYILKESIDFKEIVLNETQYKNSADNKIEYGINFSAGYGYQFNKGIIELEIRYSHGLTNIFNTRSINNSIVDQNQVLSATLAYYIKLKKNNKDVKDN